MFKQIGVIFISVIMLFSTVSLVAADVQKYRVLGFSKDGAYFAYEVYGQKDGSGSVYSSIRIVEAATGKEVGKKWDAEDFDNLNLDSLRLSNLDSSEVDLDKYRLNEDTKGNVVFLYEKLIFKPTQKADLKKLNTSITLSLTESKKECFPEQKGKLAKLTMCKGKKKTVLFEEKEPKLCIVDAKIEKVINCKNTVVCIILYSTPGFEGLDVRYKFIVAPLIK